MLGRFITSSILRESVRPVIVPFQAFERGAANVLLYSGANLIRCGENIDMPCRVSIEINRPIRKFRRIYGEHFAPGLKVCVPSAALDTLSRKDTPDACVSAPSVCEPVR